eukprot:gnl/TRDRNA2_/TRDRNA2_90560_c0_seq1.p1 gnl/TRDRNA2_/TRDRNA2_90560_c0~~gnl/TRDRNA2_/TRDRNA2_90560_c0_seq1.p1  ORF type:complete len:400 (-),score=79.02 gnl/TRDRNA2_/TRDRNA2_90560_c0_seq1:305-1504(-)
MGNTVAPQCMVSTCPCNEQGNEVWVTDPVPSLDDDTWEEPENAGIEVRGPSNFKRVLKRAQTVELVKSTSVREDMQYNFTVTKRVKREVEEHIAEVLKLVKSGARNIDGELREHMYAVASLAWHDRDSEIDHLRRSREKAYEDLAKADSEMDNRFQDAQRMVVVSSTIPETAIFCNAVRKPEWVVTYDYDTTSIQQLNETIAKKAAELQPRTVAFANHGADEQGVWALTKDCKITAAEDGGKFNVDENAAAFFQALADAAEHRVDLLACDLAAHPGGVELIKEMETATGKQIAASTNHTGNLLHGGDWVMETHNVDTASIYFDSNHLWKWDGILHASRNTSRKKIKSASVQAHEAACRGEGGIDGRGSQGFQRHPAKYGSDSMKVAKMRREQDSDSDSD